jgi:hypothetical protein
MQAGKKIIVADEALQIRAIEAPLCAATIVHAGHRG